MEKLKNFKISNLSLVYGGFTTKTVYSTSGGSTGVDMYDHDSGTMYNILGQEM